MKTDTMLSILGIILTLGLGILSIRYALKFRNKLRLTYIHEACISLFRSIVQNMDGIEISYENKPINPSLILFKGSFINNGNMDIDNSIVHEPLCMKLPPAYIWLKAKIVNSSHDVKVNCRLRNPNELEFSWDLLKKDEFFRFDSLIQAKDDTNLTEIALETKLRKSITFSHRITNLDSIEKERIPTVSKSRKIKRLLYAATFYILIGISMCVYPFFVDPAREVGYQLKNAKGEIVDVRLKPRKEDIIEIKGIDHKFSEQLKIGDLFSKYQLTPIIIFDESRKYVRYFNVTMGIISVVFSITVFVAYLLIKRKEDKLTALMHIKI